MATGLRRDITVVVPDDAITAGRWVIGGTALLLLGLIGFVAWKYLRRRSSEGNSTSRPAG